LEHEPSLRSSTPKEPTPKQISARRYSLGDAVSYTLLALAIIGIWGTILAVFVVAASKLL
jgi:hypothetical protein